MKLFLNGFFIHKNNFENSLFDVINISGGYEFFIYFGHKWENLLYNNKLYSKIETILHTTYYPLVKIDSGVFFIFSTDGFLLSVN